MGCGGFNNLPHQLHLHAPRLFVVVPVSSDTVGALQKVNYGVRQHCRGTRPCWRDITDPPSSHQPHLHALHEPAAVQ